MKSLIVEGWRFLPHSYAVVNQWQLLALSRSKSVQLKIRDLPLYHPRWRTQTGLFDDAAEDLLRSLESAAAGEYADATLRISFPFDFSPACSGRTAVFATSENQTLQKSQVADEAIYRQLRLHRAPADVAVVTPSRWSAQGFYNYGFKTEQVLIVPHGVDTESFRPASDAEARARLRAELALPADAFVFLSIGAMTGNKGIDLLLRAFAELSLRHPEARLVLKGTDALYNSKGLLRARLGELTTVEQARVRARLVYRGRSLPHQKMANLYQAADLYVSPYRAEGFNLPVLEAAACGLPILCSRGGATDDFVTDDFARRIDSRRDAHQVEDQAAMRLAPSLEHLLALMTAAIEDASWRRSAAQAGPAHVREHYTWDRIVQQLVGTLLDER